MDPKSLAKSFMDLSVEDQAEFFLQLTILFRKVMPSTQERLLKELANKIYFLDHEDDSYLNGLVVALFDQHDEEEKTVYVESTKNGLNN